MIPFPHGIGGIVLPGISRLAAEEQDDDQDDQQDADGAAADPYSAGQEWSTKNIHRLPLIERRAGRPDPNTRLPVAMSIDHGV